MKIPFSEIRKKFCFGIQTGTPNKLQRAERERAMNSML